MDQHPSLLCNKKKKRKEKKKKKEKKKAKKQELPLMGDVASFEEEGVANTYANLADRMAKLHEQFDRLKHTHHLLLESNGLMVESQVSLLQFVNNLSVVSGGAIPPPPLVSTQNYRQG